MKDKEKAERLCNFILDYLQIPMGSAAENKYLTKIMKLCRKIVKFVENNYGR